jgi:hypothetical protein
MTVARDDTSLAYGAPSYWLRHERVELFVSLEGGHLGPVSFKLKHRWVRPLSLPPWQPADVHPEFPPVLRLLRGDFFCLPFGESRQAPWPHGSPANEPWELLSRNARELRLAQDLSGPEGRIEKRIRLAEDERAVYQEHTVSGVQGRFPVGHHAILEFPEGSEGRVSVGAFTHGQVTPLPFNNPARGDYGCLKAGARFETLESVPLAEGGTTSLAEYPLRAGFEDLAMVSGPPEGLGWTAVVLDGYVWLNLKDRASLPSTLIWLSNGGRWQAPWEGRHRARLGLEEVCSYFNAGSEASRRNPLEREGIPTVARFVRREPTVFRTAMAAHPVPRDFGRVRTIEPASGRREVTVRGEGAHQVTVPLDWTWVLDRG